MGSDFTFIHCADLHLGSRFWGISREDPDLARRLYESTFESLARIVDVGVERSDFMVIAGNVYDERNETPRTRRRFAREMERYGRPVFIVRGNHDFNAAWESSIPYPDNVTVLASEPDRRTLEIDGKTIEIVGMSYPTQHTSENLAAKLRGTPGMFTIGLLHCSVTDVAQNDEYAPCAVADMLGKDIDYWALGHIHKRRILRPSGPTIVYPGNIQGRNPNETGAKGCFVIAVTGSEAHGQFVATQSVEWRNVVADITGRDDLGGLIADVKSKAPEGSVISLSFAGRGPLNKAVRADPWGLADQIAAESKCCVAVGAVSTRPDVDLDKARGGETLISEIVRAADRYRGMTDRQLLDLLCSGRGPAADVRARLRWYADNGRLRQMVEAAEMSAIDRITEGSE